MPRSPVPSAGPGFGLGAPEGAGRQTALAGFACELNGWRVRRDEPIRGTEHDLAVNRVDQDRLARAVLLVQEFLRERVLDHPLDRAAERPRAERLVPALLGKER